VIQARFARRSPTRIALQYGAHAGLAPSSCQVPSSTTAYVLCRTAGLRRPETHGCFVEPGSGERSKGQHASSDPVPGRPGPRSRHVNHKRTPPMTTREMTVVTSHAGGLG